jgi:hypothetical protein
MADREDPVTPGMERPGMEGEETPQLIAAGKVHGTPVYNRDGEHLGTIEDVMLDKRSGRVAYAVMSFGGFLGIGERHHPLPWSVLRFDPSLGGYVVDLDRDRLKDAPAYAVDSAPDWGSRDWGRQVDDYWGARSIWGAGPP